MNHVCRIEVRSRSSSQICATSLPVEPARRRHLAAVLVLTLVLFLGWGVCQEVRAYEIPVTTLNDSGIGSLRAAIVEANGAPAPPHTIVFDVTGVIQPLSPLMPLMVDGTQIRGERDSLGDACDDCEPRITIAADLLAGVPGLAIQANDCIVTGLRIIFSSAAGIEIAPGFKRNQIGQPGPECCERVWLTANMDGIRITSSGTDYNLVRNCRIDANSDNGVEVRSGPQYNWIGVDADGERNYIYDNGHNGVLFDTDLNDIHVSVERDTVAGNYIYNNGDHGVFFQGGGNGDAVRYCGVIDNQIGIDEDGVASGNGLDGVTFRGESPSNLIAENIIVNSGHNGVSLHNASNNDSIAGNRIGITESGVAMGNAANGIYIETDENPVEPDNVIMHNGTGGTGYAGVALKEGPTVSPEQNIVGSNIISANTGSGVLVTGTGTIDNSVDGNHIGTDEAGNDLGNSEFGVLLGDDATLNSLRYNVIGFNADYGIQLQDGAHANVIKGNWVGTDQAETAALGNGGGIYVKTSDNTIGGMVATASNVIVNNDGWGIQVRGSVNAQSGNQIVGNLIGTNRLGASMGNVSGGIWFGDGAVNNSVGDLPGVSGAGNTIMYNGGSGVLVGQFVYAIEVPVENRVLTNKICENTGEMITLEYGGNDMLPAPEVISAFNSLNIVTGELTGIVTGLIGFNYPPAVNTRIQVFLDTDPDCCAYYGGEFVVTPEESWIVEGSPLPTDAMIYATETSRGPDNPPEDFMQTGGASPPHGIGWWWNLVDECGTIPCPWLGIDEAGRSASWIDYNNDELLDLFIANAGSANFLLENQGDYAFEAVDIGALAAPGALTSSSVWADVNNDGFFDVYIVNEDSVNSLFTLEQGMGGFMDVTPPALADTGPGRCAAWADIDLDGDLDLYLSNMGTENKLFRNDGDFSFTDVTPSVLGQLVLTTGASWGDYDKDGLPDLYVVTAGGANGLFHNDGDLVFSDVTAGPLGDSGEGRAVVWGDFFNDSELDLYLVNRDGPNRLLHNLGDGIFEDATTGPLGDTGEGHGVSAGDVDLDGDLDLYIINGDGPKMLLNEGQGEFSLTTVAPGGGEGLAGPMGDCDMDGDLDIFAVNGIIPEEANDFLVNLQANDHHWLHVGLIGTQSNRFGIGARIEVMTGRSVQTRQVTAGTGSGGQGSIMTEFGLADAESVESVRVFWPSGLTTELPNPPIDAALFISEDNSDVEPGQLLPATTLLRCMPNPFHGTTQIDFRLERPGAVRLRIYDSVGRLVRTLVDGHRVVGLHGVVWDGRNLVGDAVGNGIYFASLETGGNRCQQKLILIK